MWTLDGSFPKLSPSSVRRWPPAHATPSDSPVRPAQCAAPMQGTRTPLSVIVAVGGLAEAVSVSACVPERVAASRRELVDEGLCERLSPGLSLAVRASVGEAGSVQVALGVRVAVRRRDSVMVAVTPRRAARESDGEYVRVCVGFRVHVILDPVPESESSDQVPLRVPVCGDGVPVERVPEDDAVPPDPVALAVDRDTVAERDRVGPRDWLRVSAAERVETVGLWVGVSASVWEGVVVRGYVGVTVASCVAEGEACIEADALVLALVHVEWEGVQVGDVEAVADVEGLADSEAENVAVGSAVEDALSVGLGEAPSVAVLTV